MVEFLPGLRYRRHLAGADDGTPALQREVELERIRIALKSPPRVLVGGILGVLVVLMAISYDAGLGAFVFQPWQVVWACACSALLTNAVLLRKRFGAGPQSEAHARRAVRNVALNASLIGAAWGSSAWVLMPAASFQQDAVVLIAVCMVLTGGAGSQAVYGPLVRSFALPFIGVFALGLLSYGDMVYGLLAVGYVTYCLSTMHYCRNQERAISTAIELSMRNEQLMQQQVAQRLEAEQAKARAESARLDAELALGLAEKADRAKISFIAAVSHDLRQPMHALVQYVGHLKRLRVDGPVAATVAKIDSSVDAMEDLMNAVLDFSKISMGSIQARKESFDIALLLRDVETQMRPMAQAKGLKLQIGALPGYVFSDKVLLERIVRNIAQNALRYTEVGGVRIRAKRHAKLTRILVSDSGIGIPAAEKGRIFEEYYQVENTARDRNKGLGLGLAIVRDLSALLGHPVRFKSLRGKGSTFSVLVPNAAPPVVISSPAQRLVQTRADDYVSGAVVMLVEDDAMARDGLVTTLGDFGCQVLSAASGHEALRMLAQEAAVPQIVVSDYRLADGENGVDVIRRIRSVCNGLYGEDTALPALVISGDTSPEEMGHVLAAELEMLHKPVSTERLYQALNSGLFKRMHG